VEEGVLLETLGFSEEEFREPFPKNTRHGKSSSSKKNKTSKAMVPFKVKSGSFLFLFMNHMRFLYFRIRFI
jgi:hypothetical protein